MSPDAFSGPENLYLLVEQIAYSQVLHTGEIRAQVRRAHVVRKFCYRSSGGGSTASTLYKPLFNNTSIEDINRILFDFKNEKY